MLAQQGAELDGGRGLLLGSIPSGGQQRPTPHTQPTQALGCFTEATTGRRGEGGGEGAPAERNNDRGEGRSNLNRVAPLPGSGCLLSSSPVPFSTNAVPVLVQSQCRPPTDSWLFNANSPGSGRDEQWLHSSPSPLAPSSGAASAAGVPACPGTNLDKPVQ